MSLAPDTDDAKPPVKETDWLVLHIDQGLLRVVRKRREGEEWLCERYGLEILRVRKYKAGAYRYLLGYKDVGDVCKTFYIERRPMAREGGWNPEQPPLYPWLNHPFKMDTTIDESRR